MYLPYCFYNANFDLGALIQVHFNGDVKVVIIFVSSVRQSESKSERMCLTKIIFKATLQLHSYQLISRPFTTPVQVRCSHNLRVNRDNAQACHKECPSDLSSSGPDQTTSEILFPVPPAPSSSLHYVIGFSVTCTKLRQEQEARVCEQCMRRAGTARQGRVRHILILNTSANNRPETIAVDVMYVYDEQFSTTMASTENSAINKMKYCGEPAACAVQCTAISRLIPPQTATAF
ncbi:hypothetical protein J6590_083377 [Homalodisca vitripennis]|nr:hypothetical protein J6590_083377 [Homalodisca vitripennis]